MHGREQCVWWEGACMMGACMTGGIHRRGHVRLRWGICGRLGIYGKGGDMHGREACMAGRHAWQGGMHGRRDGHCSRWYTSHWNTFFLMIETRITNYNVFPMAFLCESSVHIFNSLCGTRETVLCFPLQIRFIAKLLLQHKLKCYTPSHF